MAIDPVSLGLGIVSIGSGLISGSKQRKAMRRQARFEQFLAEQRARFSEIGRKDALYQGERKQQQIMRNARQLEAEQLLAGASQGQDVTRGVTGKLVEETGFLSSLDIETVKNESLRQAFGYEVEKFNILTSNQMNQLALKNAQSQSRASDFLGAATAAIGAYRSSTQKKIKSESGKP